MFLNECKLIEPSSVILIELMVLKYIADAVITSKKLTPLTPNKRIIDANRSDGTAKMQTRMVTNSARQMIKHLQGFINDVDHGVYSQRVLAPTPSAIIGYSNIINHTSLNERYQNARKGIRQVNKIVGKLEQKRNFHVTEVDSLKKLFKLMEQIQDMKINQLPPNSSELPKYKKKKDFFKALYDEVESFYTKYVTGSTVVAENMEYLMNLSHMSSNSKLMMGGGGSGKSTFNMVQKEVNQLNDNRKRFYNSFKRTVQEYSKSLESM